MKTLNIFAHWVSWLVGNALFKLFFDFRVEGIENLKKIKGAAVIAFNHGSWLDPFFVFAAIPPSSGVTPIHFATWHIYYWLFFPFPLALGSFPVKRGVGLEKTLTPAVRFLEKKEPVGIAPEGKRRHLGRKRKPRRGVAYLALKTKAAVLPVYLKGNIGLSFMDISRPDHKITAKIKRPIPSNRWANRNLDKDNLANVAEKIMYTTYTGE